MKFKTQKSVTDKITSNNLKQWVLTVVYCVQHLTYILFMNTLKLTTHSVIYGVKAEFPIKKSLNCGIIMLFAWFELFVLLQSLSAKIVPMSISELLPNRPAAAMISDDNNAREIIRYFIDVQNRAKFLGVISSHAQIPKPIFILRAYYNGKRGLFLFTYRKYCYYFPTSFYS